MKFACYTRTVKRLDQIGIELGLGATFGRTIVVGTLAGRMARPS